MSSFIPLFGVTNGFIFIHNPPNPHFSRSQPHTSYHWLNMTHGKTMKSFASRCKTRATKIAESWVATLSRLRPTTLLRTKSSKTKAYKSPKRQFTLKDTVDTGSSQNATDSHGSRFKYSSIYSLL